MTTFNSTVNTQTLVMVNGTEPSLTVIPDLALYLNGVLNSTSVTVAYVGTGNLYTLTFTPTSTGIYNLFCFGEIQARINVMTRSDQSFLQNIEDECLGSWSWDKTGGTLTLLRQDGTTLNTYNVTDTLTTASRELSS
jgi:hypothetical protein